MQINIKTIKFPISNIIKKTIMNKTKAFNL